MILSLPVLAAVTLVMAGPAPASPSDAPPISVPSALPALDEGGRLRDAAAAGRTAEIEALLARGVPVDIPDVDGETALMKSIEADQPEAAALLRRHGASISVRNRAGLTALDLVAGKTDDALYKALGL